MWIERKKFEALVKRVDDLEKRTSLGLVAGLVYEAYYGVPSHEVPINRIVAMLVADKRFVESTTEAKLVDRGA